jgi:hypothetical protein
MIVRADTTKEVVNDGALDADSTRGVAFERSVSTFTRKKIMGSVAETFVLFTQPG